MIMGVLNVIYITDGCNKYEWGTHTIDMGVKLGIVGDSYVHEDLHFLKK